MTDKREFKRHASGKEIFLENRTVFYERNENKCNVTKVYNIIFLLIFKYLCNIILSNLILLYI